MVELIENGIDAEKRKQQESFHLAERFSNETDAPEAKSSEINWAVWSLVANAQSVSRI